jgi:hypothetical protein
VMIRFISQSTYVQDMETLLSLRFFGYDLISLLCLSEFLPI